MLKAVLFDMDGVLVDSELIFYEADRRLLKELGHSFTKNYYKQYVGTTCEYMWNKIIMDYSLKVTAEYMDIRGREIVGEILAENGGYPEVHYAGELVKRLCKKYKLAVASSSSLSSIERNMYNMGISDCFERLVSGEAPLKPKPAPDVFLKAAEELGVKPCECVVIEDSCNGVLAAKAAGMACIGYANENSGNQDLSKADYIVTDFEGITREFVDMVYCHTFNEPWHVMDTERMSIWEMSDEDVSELQKIILCENLPLVTGFSKKQQQERILNDEYMKAYRKNMYSFYGYGLWAFKDILTDEIIGFGGIDEKGYLGYIIKDIFRGRGYCMEAITAVTEYAFSEAGLDLIYAETDDDNIQSVQVLKNLGFLKIEGTGKSTWMLRKKSSI